MQNNTNKDRLIYGFDDEGFNINIFESKISFYVKVAYEEDASFYPCNSLLEANLVMYNLLMEYWDKKRIVEEVINRL